MSHASELRQVQIEDELEYLDKAKPGDPKVSYSFLCISVHVIFYWYERQCDSILRLARILKPHVAHVAWPRMLHDPDQCWCSTQTPFARDSFLKDEMVDKLNEALTYAPPLTCAYQSNVLHAMTIYPVLYPRCQA